MITDETIIEFFLWKAFIWVLRKTARDSISEEVGFKLRHKIRKCQSHEKPKGRQ